MPPRRRLWSLAYTTVRFTWFRPAVLLNSVLAAGQLRAPLPQLLVSKLGADLQWSQSRSRLTALKTEAAAKAYTDAGCQDPVKCRCLVSVAT
jgi:hypothetical protein